MRTLLMIVITGFVFCVSEVQGQTTVSDADRQAITQTALDYVEGWYEANPERMERALHPDLAKVVERAAEAKMLYQSMECVSREVHCEHGCAAVGWAS